MSQLLALYKVRLQSGGFNDGGIKWFCGLRGNGQLERVLGRECPLYIKSLHYIAILNDRWHCLLSRCMVLIYGAFETYHFENIGNNMNCMFVV